MRLFYLLVFSLFALSVFAQDPQFSQFYANPLYHNPAFAGYTGKSRLSVNYRNQWPALGANYQTAVASFDTYLDPGAGSVGVGFGALAMHDVQGNQVKTSSLAMQGAGIIGGRDGGLRFIGAGQVAFSSGVYNPNGLTFVDQFSSAGLSNPVSSDPLAQVGLTRNTLNFATGVLLETNYEDKPSFMVGATFHNMGQRAERGYLTSRRFGVQAAVTLPMNQSEARQRNDLRESLTLTAYYRNQGPDQQLDAGINYLREPLLLGVWYRGIPLRKYNQTSQRDALIALVGWQLTEFPLTIQYSYDMTVSSLSWATGGAHELTLRYYFDPLFALSGRRGQSKKSLRCVRKF